ncbi:MAG: biopolymer transporter ExbD [Endomicrobium sp.]|jgi:biopolymer transport protein ExbD|nr:biopolymer transporter ExbD [Endomicrobium sp.]
MKARIQRSKVKTDINIAPFTDVILVLLIIFMISTPALMQPGITVNLPKTKITDATDSSNMEVKISREQNIYVDDKKTELENVEAVVKEWLVSNPNQSIVIKGDEQIPYNLVIQFMDRAKSAGATKFALAVDNANTSGK